MNSLSAIPFTSTGGLSNSLFDSHTVSFTAPDQLREAKNNNVNLRVYSDAEMTAAGAGSFHHVEIPVMEDESYFKWMLGHHLAE